jgi:hypothetical protein
MARSALGKRVCAGDLDKDEFDRQSAWERPAMMERDARSRQCDGAELCWLAGVGSAVPFQASGDICDSYAALGITAPTVSQPDPLSACPNNFVGNCQESRDIMLLLLRFY